MVTIWALRQAVLPSYFCARQWKKRSFSKAEKAISGMIPEKKRCKSVLRSFIIDFISILIPRLAFKLGHDIVPVYHLGNTRLFDHLSNERVSEISRKLKFTFFVAYGRYVS
jgi:hypothetical protein